MRSHNAYPYGRITMVPRTGPLSANSALVMTSWYQRGESSACGVSTAAMSQMLLRPTERVSRVAPAACWSSADHAAAQHDPPRIVQRGRVDAWIRVVADEVPRRTLDQSRQPEPLAGPP